MFPYPFIPHPLAFPPLMILLYYFIIFLSSISLEVMTLNPKCDLVETAQGVAVTVTGVCQVKIMTEPRLLKTACEQFLGKSAREVESVVLQTLEGHLRAILGTLTVEEIYKGLSTMSNLKLYIEFLLKSFSHFRV